MDTKEYQKQYRLKNKEKIEKYHKEYNNNSFTKLKNHQWYLENIEKIKERSKQYYQDHKEEIKAYRRRYMKEHPGKSHEYYLRYRQRIATKLVNYGVYDTKKNGECILIAKNLKEVSELLNRKPASISCSMSKGCLIQRRYEVVRLNIEKEDKDEELFE